MAQRLYPDEICDCGHQRHQHYGFDSYCLYTKLIKDQCKCGIFTLAPKLHQFYYDKK